MLTQLSSPTLALERSDAELLLSVLAGNARDFEPLMRRYNRRLFRITRAILRNDAEAEDAMQEAYLQAFANLRQFEGRSSFATWLTRIAIHAACARARDGKRLTVFDDDDATALDLEQHPMSARLMAQNPEKLANAHELTHLVEGAVDALPDHYRVVFVLRAVEELTVTETAACLGLSEEVVRTRYFRARALLQKALLERVDEAAPQAFDFHLSRCQRVVDAVFDRLRIEAARS